MIIDKGKPLVYIGAWCLMTNHFHLLIRQETDGGITKFISIRLIVGDDRPFVCFEKIHRFLKTLTFTNNVFRVQFKTNLYKLHHLAVLHNDKIA